MPMRTSSLLSTALLAALAGCGGTDTPGLDPNSSAPPFQPAPGIDFDVRAAWRNFLAATRSSTVSGIGSDGNPYTVAITTETTDSAVFPATGVAASRSDTTLAVAGAAVTTALVQSVFFDPTAAQVIGLIEQQDGATQACDVAIETTEPPAAAQIPSSGPLATLARRDDCVAGPVGAATAVFTWSLDQRAGINLFCLNRDVLGVADPPRQHCVEVRPDGSLGDGAAVALEFGPLTDPISIEAASP